MEKYDLLNQNFGLKIKEFLDLAEELKIGFLSQEILRKSGDGALARGFIVKTKELSLIRENEPIRNIEVCFSDNKTFFYSLRPSINAYPVWHPRGGHQKLSKLPKALLEFKAFLAEGKINETKHYRNYPESLSHLGRQIYTQKLINSIMRALA